MHTVLTDCALSTCPVMQSTFTLPLPQQLGLLLTAAGAFIPYVSFQSLIVVLVLTIFVTQTHVLLAFWSLLIKRDTEAMAPNSLIHAIVHWADAPDAAAWVVAAAAGLLIDSPYMGLATMVVAHTLVLCLTRHVITVADVVTHRLPTLLCTKAALWCGVAAACIVVYWAPRAAQLCWLVMSCSVMTVRPGRADLPPRAADILHQEVSKLAFVPFRLCVGLQATRVSQKHGLMLLITFPIMLTVAHFVLPYVQRALLVGVLCAMLLSPLFGWRVTPIPSKFVARAALLTVLWVATCNAPGSSSFLLSALGSMVLLFGIPERNEPTQPAPPVDANGEALVCPISHEQIQESSWTPCGHAFERAMLLRHLGRDPRCPVCRRAVRIHEVQRHRVPVRPLSRRP